jgi:hypothetical protein
MSSHTMIVTCVRWGGEGLIYSGSRDCCINVWSAEEGKLVRTLKGHAHWVNTLALSTEAVLRSGAYDHTGKAPADQQEAMQVRPGGCHVLNAVYMCTLSGCGYIVLRHLQVQNPIMMKHSKAITPGCALHSTDSPLYTIMYCRPYIPAPWTLLHHGLPTPNPKFMPSNPEPLLP